MQKYKNIEIENWYLKYSLYWSNEQMLNKYWSRSQLRFGGKVCGVKPMLSNFQDKYQKYPASNAIFPQLSPECNKAKYPVPSKSFLREFNQPYSAPTSSLNQSKARFSRVPNSNFLRWWNWNGSKVCKVLM